MNPRKRFRWKPHRHFQLVVPLNDIGVFLPFSEAWPVHKSTHPGKMAVDRHGKIAAVDHPFAERGLEAFLHMAATQRNVEGAGVSVEVLESSRHPGKYVKIFGVKEAAFRPAVSGDDRN